MRACIRSLKPPRQFEHAFADYENDDVACGVEDCGTDLARLEIALDVSAQLGIDLASDVRRDLLADVIAVDSHLPHPNRPLRLGANPFNFGARLFCNRAPARCRQTLTAPSLIPSVAQVSRTSISSMSLSSITLRQNPGRLAIAARRRPRPSLRSFQRTQVRNCDPPRNK